MFSAFIEKHKYTWVNNLIEKRNVCERSDVSKVSMFPHDMEQSDLVKQWLNFVGVEENKSSYSEVLLSNAAFRDYAEASTITKETKDWFEKIILGKADEMFDNLCQQINQRLLKFLIATAEEKKKPTKRGTGGTSYHIKVFNMLQTTTIDGIIDGNIPMQQRTGIVSVILVLNNEMQKKQRKGLIRYAENLSIQKEGEGKKLNVRDVNKIMGWAIFHLRLKKIKMIRKMDEEDNKKGIQLRKEIDFLSSMRFYAEEALQSESYLDGCYDTYLRSLNRGRLTLVNEEYFQFGVVTMEKVAAALTQEKLRNDINVTENAKKAVLNDIELFDVFLDCSKNNTHVKDRDNMKNIFSELLEKVVNARFSEEMRAYTEEYTTRGSKNNPTKLALRPSLDSYSLQKSKRSRM